MNSRRESKLNMFRAVKLLLDNNMAIITNNIAFLAIYNAFKAKLSTLLITVAAEAEVITGITTSKTEAKKKLAENAADIAAIVYAYASAVNNNQLKESVNFSYYELYRIKDDLLSPTCQNIHDVAHSLLTPLAEYGVNASMLTSFQNTITAYSDAVPKPRNAKNMKGTYTKNINLKIKEIDALLKDQMDKSITIFKSAYPDLLSTYTFARIIIDPGRTSTQFKGSVRNATDNTALKDAKIEIKGPELYLKMSNDDGEFSFKPLKFGNYQISVTLDGYKAYMADNFKVKLGKVNTLDIQLQSA